MDAQQKNEKDKIRTGEWLMILFTFGIWATSVVAALIFSCQLGVMKGQLKEMESGSKDTHTLAEAAKVQADASKTAAEAALKTAAATQQMVKKADESIKATRDSVRLDQRAWVGPIMVMPATSKDAANKSVYLKEGSPIILGTIITNSGKSPALKVRTLINARDLPSGVKFSPDYGKYPNPAITVIQPNMQLSLSTNPMPSLTASDIDIFRSGKRIVYLFGKITYEDVFEGPHSTTFCMSLAPSLDTFVSCETYNEAD